MFLTKLYLLAIIRSGPVENETPYFAHLYVSVFHGPWQHTYASDQQEASMSLDTQQKS